MSLQDIYNELYSQEDERVASVSVDEEVEKVASIIDAAGLDEEECEKLAWACDALDEEGYEFESVEDKLAAAAEVVDSTEGVDSEEDSDDVDAEDQQSEDEKTASEFDALGRIMAQGLMDELNKEAVSVAGAKDLAKGVGGKILGALKSTGKAIKGAAKATDARVGISQMRKALKMRKSGLSPSFIRGELKAGGKKALKGGAATAALYGTPLAAAYAAGRKK